MVTRAMVFCLKLYNEGYMGPPGRPPGKAALLCFRGRALGCWITYDSTDSDFERIKCDFSVSWVCVCNNNNPWIVLK